MQNTILLGCLLKTWSKLAISGGFTVGSQLLRIIEMPELTSLLVFVVFCAKKVKWRKSVP
jgi:hypothetical protein